jgi:N-acetylated-alpha-linked acidic dipeptidase
VGGCPAWDRLLDRTERGRRPHAQWRQGGHQANLVCPSVAHHGRGSRDSGTSTLSLRVTSRTRSCASSHLQCPAGTQGARSILGNHRDAWIFGAGDPSSGTSTIHDVVKAFGVLRRQGWKPARTIMIASWDAEEVRRALLRDFAWSPSDCSTA